MPKVTALKTSTDIARALQTLGLSLDELGETKSKHTRDPSLAKALKHAVEELSRTELKQLRAAVGDASANVATRNESGASGVESRLALSKKGAPIVVENTAPVAALLGRYGVKDTASRPLERVLVHIAKLDEILRSEPDVQKLVDAVMQLDLRRHVFLVEGWTRLYSRIIPEADALGESFKELEDALGAVSATRSNLAFAVEKRAPLSVIKVLERERDDTRAALARLLSSHFTPDARGRVPRIASAITSLRKADLDDYVGDRKAVKDELARRLEKISSGTYDMNDLQGGLHELRRHLRWFPIFAESLNGLVQLDVTQNPVKAYEHFLTTPLATSKYMDLPSDAREVNAFQVPKSLYAALMQVTLDLGALKDAGEPIERLMHAYLEAGLAQDLVDAHRMVAKLIGGESHVSEIHTRAEVVYAEMKKNRLVERITAVFTRK